MNVNDLKIGDTVKLKSGSPTMTIANFILALKTKERMDIVKCAWFEGTKEFRSEFKVDMLEKV